MNLPFSTRLALRQIRYKGWGLIGACAGIAVAVVLIFAQLGFQGALVNSVLNLCRALKADIVLTGPQFETIAYSPPWFARDILYAAREVEGVRDALPAYIYIAQTRDVRDSRPLVARFIAFDPAYPILNIPEIERQTPELRLPDAVLLDSRSRQGFEQLLALYQRDGMQRVYLQSPNADLAPAFDVRGTFSLGPDFTLPGTFVTSDLNYYRFFGVPLDRVALGLVTLAPGVDKAGAVAALQARLGDAVQVRTLETFMQAERDYFTHSTPIGIIFMFGVGVGVLIGAVFVLQVLHGIIEANLSEYAVLRAMGYGDNFFLALVVQVATVLAVMAFLPSVLLTMLLYQWASTATGLTLALSPGLILTVFLATLIMSIIAVVLALRKLRRSNPLDLFT